MINDLSIAFNGEGDESCETFYLTKSPQDFNFCKTRQNPYDEVVVDVMREARNINPSFNPRSDGDGVFGNE